MKSQTIYPEHDKLKAIKRKSQACGEFLEWLEGKGIHLARVHRHGPGCRGWDEHRSKYNPDRDSGMCEFFDGQLYMTTEPMTKLLAEHFGIDPIKLDDEKRDMIERLRGQAA